MWCRFCATTSVIVVCWVIVLVVDGGFEVLELLVEDHVELALTHPIAEHHNFVRPHIVESSECVDKVQAHGSKFTIFSLR